MAYRKIKIDFSGLPQKNNKVLWDKCINHSINYTIDGTEYFGTITIEESDGNKLKIKADNNGSHIIYKTSFKNGKIAKLLGEKAKYYKYEVGDAINNLVILKRILITKNVSDSNYGIIPSTENGYYVKCLHDGYKFEILEKELSKNKGCPVCGHLKVIKGINDISSTDPEFAKWVANEEDAFTHTRNTNKKILLRCPVCGREFIGIPNRYKTLPSCVCNDNISYPEKFMSSILNQLHVPYIYQLTSSYFDWCKNYRYDFYFEHENKKYIIEMDGAFHYMYNYKNNTSVEDSKRVDSFKTELAENNGCIVIRINSFYSNIRIRHDFIKTNIINSELSSLFDLSVINWDECENYCMTSMIEMVSKLWNDGLSCSEICNVVKLDRSTVCEYLKTGKKLSMNDYEPKARHYISNADKKYLKVTNKENEVICIYLGIQDFIRNSESILGFSISSTQVYRNLKNKKLNIKNGLYFSYATKEEFEDYISNKK